ncbi:MAG: hypothetical protein CL396_07440 [Acidiferrobacteraceae bacterium]|jgi:ABC-type nitrate/sulfonate/bicarbonate transport system substrate-binding protein|nr:hypothetical protein [Acidiferrobacteraceae bacterium]
MKRQILGLLMCCFIAPLGLAQAAETVKIGYLPYPDLAEVMVAVDKGFFAKYNIEPVLEKDFSTGSDIFVAVVSGQVDVGINATMNTVTAISGGGFENVRILHTGSGYTASPLDGKYTKALLVSLTSNTDITEDPLTWQGKSLGSNTPGDLLEFAVQEQIVDKGGKANMEIVGTGGFHMVQQMMDQGLIDIGFVIEPFVSFVMSTGNYKIIGTPWAMWGNEVQALSWATNTDFLENSPEAAKGTANAFSDAIDWINDPNNDAEYKDIMAKWSGMPMELLDTLRYSLFAKELDVGALQSYIGRIVEYGVIDEEINISDYIADVCPSTL